MSNKKKPEWDPEDLPEHIQEFLEYIMEAVGDDVDIEIVFTDEEDEDYWDTEDEDVELIFPSQVFHQKPKTNFDLSSILNSRAEGLNLERDRLQVIYDLMEKVHNLKLNDQEKQMIAFAYSYGLMDGGN